MLGCDRVVIVVLVEWIRWMDSPPRSLSSWFVGREATAAAMVAAEVVEGEVGVGCSWWRGCLVIEAIRKRFKEFHGSVRLEPLHHKTLSGSMFLPRNDQSLCST